MKRRIVVTGMGVVSCFGQDVNTFYEKLLAGESGITPITSFPCEDFSTRFAAQVRDFDSSNYIDKKQARRIDRFIAYGMVAGKKALEMAGLFPQGLEQINKARAGILIGAGMGGMDTFADGMKTLLEKGNKRITPFLIPYILSNMAGGLLAIDCGFMGPNYSVSTACATSNYAITLAAEHLRRGEVDLMICGGVEAPISPIGLGGFCAIKALSERNDAPTKASRPWDKNRDGFVMAEGSGCIVLETLEHALARKAPIFAEYLGGAFSCDAHHMTEPHPNGEGVAVCIQKALQDAGVREDQIDYINAHATSTPAGDMCEVNAMKKVFSKPEKAILNATKSMIGHSLGASGALEAVATIKALHTGIVHPTINLEEPEELQFFVPTIAHKAPIVTAISNSFGFGGHNASIIFKKFTG